MKKFICYVIVLAMMLLIIGCSEEPEDSVIDNSVEDIITDSQDELSEVESSTTDTPVVTIPVDESIGTQDTEVVDNDTAIYVAKSYAEIYPELFDFYEPTENTYTRWVYSITANSNFIGSIYLPDGRIIVGNGKASDDFSIDMTDDAYKTKPSTTGTVQTEFPVVNPKGTDFTIPTLAGDIVASTRFKEDLMINEINSTEYKFELNAGDATYILEECTNTSYLEKLFNDSIYNVTGSVSADNQSLVRTSFATYVKYTIQTSDGVYEYASVCIPYSMSDTVFILYNGKDYQTDIDLFGTIQTIFEGTNT